MRAKFLAITAVVASGIIATTFLVQSLSSSSAQTPARQLPEYTASGELVLPKNFHEWVYVVPRAHDDFVCIRPSHSCKQGP